MKNSQRKIVITDKGSYIVYEKPKRKYSKKKIVKKTPILKFLHSKNLNNEDVIAPPPNTI